MTMRYRRAQEAWTPTNWDAFLKRAHADANAEQLEELLKTATVDDLRDMVRDLNRRLAGATFAAECNADTIRAMRSGGSRG